ncbi:hypothetical protein [Enterococcus faecalis]|uniref:hypothetical protein n=1 Tax=Enterococcus faecalis TaxID=1351 RepID=UPI0010BF864E|nr:hypothetical protein [Enterococcus faecalis]TKP12714.1 hypothetical protein DVY31_14110 [Enterococcus faecalis]
MIGYHGTSKECAESIIKSQKFNVDTFIIYGDCRIKSGQRMPNDFGSGIYMFLTNDCYDGIKCAKNYANTFKDVPTTVLEINIKDDCITCIDFEDKKTMDIFNKIREKIYDRIYYNYQMSVKDSGSKKRANLDGLFIEYLVQYKYNNQIDAVMGLSYTPSYNKQRSISNFPNGKEICLRSNEFICWDKCKEVKL